MSSSVYLDRVKIKRQNLICECGGTGRRARLWFCTVCEKCRMMSAECRI